MINEALKPLLAALDTIPYITKLGGCVTTITRKIENKEKKFPVYINGDPSTCSPDDYIDFIPNSDELATVYFEDYGTTADGKTRRKVEMRSKLRLVGFINLKKMNIQDTTQVVVNILDKFPHLPSSESKAKNIRFAFLGEEPKTDAIFNRYTYNEAEKQYLIYPFGYFALNIEILWDLPFGCIDQLEIPDPEILC